MYAGGGAGGSTPGGIGNTGGSGGGGNSSTGSSSGASPQAGVANTGGGGGGSLNPSYYAGNGGSGIVILSYANTVSTPSISGGLTYSGPSSNGSNYYIKFTAGTGTVTF
jgi:hypothetical protein